MDEYPPDSYQAIYICGVAKEGYANKKNYEHNVHAAISPRPGAVETWSFEKWYLQAPSQANQFLNCSARWWFKYGAGLPDPKCGSLVRGFIAMCHPSRRSSKLKAYGTWNSTANWT